MNLSELAKNDVPSKPTFENDESGLTSSYLIGAGFGGSDAGVVCGACVAAAPLDSDAYSAPFRKGGASSKRLVLGLSLDEEEYS